jgi:hypothetical protein
MESLHIASKDGHNVKVSGSDAGSPKIFDEGVSNVPAKYRGGQKRHDKLGQEAGASREYLFASQARFS